MLTRYLVERFYDTPDAKYKTNGNGCGDYPFLSCLTLPSVHEVCRPHNQTNPCCETEALVGEAPQLTPESLEYIQRGDKISCNEQQYKAAIATREFLLGPSDPATAKCYNGLGDLYIKLGRLEEAEEYLSRALQVRSSGPLFDAAVTRDNLGCIYEMKGDIQKAREMRITDEHVICGLYEVCCALYIICVITFRILNRVQCASQRLYRLNEISR